jgi:hypothetical protein
MSRNRAHGANMRRASIFLICVTMVALAPTNAPATSVSLQLGWRICSDNNATKYCDIHMHCTCSFCYIIPTGTVTLIGNLQAK